MVDDDYCPQCFECDGECVNGENGTLVCEYCGHVYTDEEWDEDEEECQMEMNLDRKAAEELGKHFAKGFEFGFENMVIGNTQEEID